MWFNSNGTYGIGMDILTKGTIAGKKSFNFAILGVSGTVRCSINDGTNIPYININVLNGNDRHIIFVVDNTNTEIRAYVDGALKGTVPNTVTSTTIGSNKDMALGLEVDSPNAAGVGIAVSRLAIWNKALTQDDINALFNIGNGKLYNDF